MSAAVDQMDARRAARELYAGLLLARYSPGGFWTYENADGSPCYYKARFNPPGGTDRRKEIRPLHFDGAAWRDKLPKVRPLPLYALPELLARPHDRVFVTEGEKSCNALRKLGLLATTSGGANSAKSADWTPLKRRACTIWPDFDPAGANYAEAVRAILVAQGSDVDIVDAAVLGLPNKGDAADWIAEHAGATSGDVEALPRVSRSDDSEPWHLPQPLPTGMPPVQAFNPEWLPLAFRGWTMDIAHRLQCAPDFPAVSAMVAISAVVGRQIGIRPKERDNWLVVPNLWGAIVGRPSVLKSPAIAEATKPLRHLEARAREEHQHARAEHAAQQIVAEIAAKEATKEIAKAARNDRERALALARNVAAGNEHTEPSEPRYSTSDCTVEKLGELLKDNPRGILVLRDELMGFLRGLDKEGQEGARTFYLEGWNGTGHFDYDRIGRGHLHIESATVSLLGGTQPGPLTHYMRDALRGGKCDDGLAQRFQLLVWPDHDSFQLVDQWPDTAARRAAYQVFDRLDTVDSDAVRACRDDDGAIPFLRFDSSAQDVFNAWYVDLQKRVRAGDLPACMEAHLAKFASLVPSIALLIQLVDDGRGPVGLDAVTRACAWAGYLESHARRLYAPALLGEDIAGRELAKRIVEGKLEDGFQLRDVYRKGWTGLGTREDAEAGVRVLLELGGLQEEIRETGGRPAITYRINPRCREAW